MPRVIPCAEVDSITLEELTEYLFEKRIDTSDHDSLTSAAPMLKRLANNRDFMVDQVIAELKANASLQVRSPYGPQVFMLHQGRRKQQNFAIRACFWPSLNDQILKVSGDDPFSYHLPHDHNFNFLTVGYSGPGYWSNYYECDHENVVGYPGEAVNLRFVEKSRLSEGKVMLYRAFIDVHDQLPADAFSVSLNIMESTPRSEYIDQYSFNISSSTIGNIVNPNGSLALFDVVSFLGSEEDRYLIRDLANKHPINRVRCSAWQSLSSAAPSAEAALDILRSIPATAPSLVKGWARQRIQSIEASLK